MIQAQTRVRRPKEASKQAILDAAEVLLLAEGPDGVRVQRVAAAVGVTDAGVHYHFGNRAGPMAALLRQCGRKLVGDIASASASGQGLKAVSRAMKNAYVDRGAARMMMWLKLAGWRPRGKGMLTPLVGRLHALRI